jgi:hypothetical protein
MVSMLYYEIEEANDESRLSFVLSKLNAFKTMREVCVRVYVFTPITKIHSIICAEGSEGYTSDGNDLSHGDLISLLIDNVRI